jgi:hypothetical protein
MMPRDLPKMKRYFDRGRHARNTLSSHSPPPQSRLAPNPGRFLLRTHLPQLESILRGLGPPSRDLALPPSGGKGRAGDAAGKPGEVCHFVIYALPSRPLTSQHTQDKTPCTCDIHNDKPAIGRHVGDFGSSLFCARQETRSRPDALLTKEHPSTEFTGKR